MAKIVFGGGVALASGKIGGTVYARNKGGSYSRNWVVPTNPQTSRQNNQRNLLALKAAAWRSLSDGERDAWATWAGDNPILDRVGNSIVLSGAQAYNKININRTNAADAAAQTTPPSTAEFTADIVDTSDNLSIEIAAAFFRIPLAAGAAADQILFTWACKPVSAGVTNTTAIERKVEVVTLTGADVSNGYYSIYTNFVDYFGTITGKTGFRVNVAVNEYDEGQFSVPAKVTGTIDA